MWYASTLTVLHFTPSCDFIATSTSSSCNILLINHEGAHRMLTILTRDEVGANGSLLGAPLALLTSTDLQSLRHGDAKDVPVNKVAVLLGHDEDVVSEDNCCDHVGGVMRSQRHHQEYLAE